MWGYFGALLRRFKHKPFQPSDRPPDQAWVSLWPDTWLVVKNPRLCAVERALRLFEPRRCSWLEGFAGADTVFLAPPVKGWILVTGSGLPSPKQDVDVCFRFILDISRRLGQVQFFCAGRATRHHAWLKADQGCIVRAYAWAGQTLWQQGEMTREESELDVVCFDYAEPDSGSALDPSLTANIEKVPLLAARWGLDPIYVQRHLPLNACGIVGKAACWY